jgi:MFS family permease
MIEPRPTRRPIELLNLAGMGPDISWMFWGMILWNFGLGLYVNLWPLYVEDLGATATQIGLVIGLQAFARMFVMIPGGIMADRFDRRRVIWFFTFLCAPATLIFAVAQTWWHIVPGLVIFGASSIAVASNGSYVAQAARNGDRARVFTLVYTVGPAFALIAGPLVGGWVSDRWGIRVLLVAGAGFYAVAAWFFSRIRPLAVNRVAGEKRATYREALRQPAQLPVSLLMLGALLVMTIGITFIPNYQQDVYGMSMSEISLLGAIGAIGSVLFAMLIGKARWLTPSRGIALSVTGVALVCVLVAVTGDLATSIALFPLRGGYTVAWVLFGAILSEATSDRLRGHALGLMEFFGTFGFAVAPLVAGPMYGHDPRWPLIAAAALTPALIVAALVIERRVVRPATARASEAAAVGATAS